MAYPLITERLSIAPLAGADAADFARYRQEPGVALYQSWSADFSEAAALRIVAGQPAGDLPGPGQWLQLGVHSRNGGQLLGDVAVHRLSEQPGTFELGVTFAGEHQGRGYATESMLALLGFLFDVHGAHRVLAHCDARNGAVAAVLRKAGLRQESRQVEADWFKGEWTTLDTYALLGREWPTRTARG